jgi:hypothetical protein
MRKYLSYAFTLLIAGWLIYYIWHAWQPKHFDIYGHDYIEYPNMYDSKLIHNPECDKCKSEN